MNAFTCQRAVFPQFATFFLSGSAPYQPTSYCYQPLAMAAGFCKRLHIRRPLGARPRASGVRAHAPLLEEAISSQSSRYQGRLVQKSLISVTISHAKPFLNKTYASRFPSHVAVIPVLGLHRR